MPPRSPLVRWLFRSTLALFATLSVLAGAQARAEPGGSLTFIEVRIEARGDVAHSFPGPGERTTRAHLTDRARVDIAMQQLTVAASQSDGSLGFVAWQQTERPNHFHFNLISGWNSESQFHPFAATRAAREFRQIVGSMSGSPYDERLFRRVD